ncbi:MAG: glycosyltransferase family 4 protein [Phycisphaerae bacterium]|nr:glycosyltransferase family 4 protein [Phycisphaerae bacterium]
MSVRAKYRILLIENDPNIGGSGRSLRALIDGLDRSEFEVSAVCDSTGPIGRSVEDRGVKCYWPGGVPRPGRWSGSHLAWIWWLRRLIRRQHIDLVHVNDIAGFRLAGLASRLARVPSLCHFRMARRAEGLAWAFGLARPAAIIFNSRAMAEYTRPLLPASIASVHAVIAPNAVDTERFRPAISVSAAKAAWGWPEDVLTVTVVSNLSPLKGQDVFLDAARLVADRLGRPVDFHLFGRDLTPGGRFTESLRKQAYVQGMTGQVHIHGPVEDVVPAYQASDVVVCPMRFESVCPSGDGTRVLQVGFPRCVIEAASCGRPAVISAVPGAEEAAVANETGLFILPDDPNGMAEAVLSLLRDTDRREAMGLAARKRIETHFGIAQHGRLIATVYRSVLGVSSSRDAAANAVGEASETHMIGGVAR